MISFCILLAASGIIHIIPILECLLLAYRELMAQAMEA